jgi:hypothetical protein
MLALSWTSSDRDRVLALPVDTGNAVSNAIPI